MDKKDIVKEILEIYPDEKAIVEILNKFEDKIIENFVVDILIEKRNKKIKERCWNENGCIFKPNSEEYMKCWVQDYSVNKCREEEIKGLKI